MKSHKNVEQEADEQNKNPKREFIVDHIEIIIWMICLLAWIIAVFLDAPLSILVFLGSASITSLLIASISNLVEGKILKARIKDSLIMLSFCKATEAVIADLYERLKKLEKAQDKK